MSADDNTPEQAREVVRDVLYDHGLQQGGGGLHAWRCDYPEVFGECNCLDELATDLTEALAVWDREAEQQATAQVALLSAAEDHGWFDATDPQHHVEDFRDGVRAMQDRLRIHASAIRPGVSPRCSSCGRLRVKGLDGKCVCPRADGVTGRSGA